MKVGDIVKQKNPALPFQEELRYEILSIEDGQCRCKEVNDPFIYDDIELDLFVLAD